MNNEKLKCVLKILIIVLIVALIIYVYISRKKETNVIPYSDWTDKEKVEELEIENEKYQDEICHLESQLEELQKEYEEKEDLITLLREQLESYNIEPYEL